MSTISLILTLCLTACFGNPSNNSQDVIAMATVDKARIISETEFKTLVMDFEKHNEWTFKGDLPTIVDFYADWCPPCRRLAPILDELAREYAGKINIYKVNVDHSRTVAAFFGIQSLPTLLFAPMDGMPALQAGLMSKAQLVHAIENFLLQN